MCCVREEEAGPLVSPYVTPPTQLACALGAANGAGVGISRQRQAIVGGLRDSVAAFSNEVQGTSASQVMDMMVLTQVSAPDTIDLCDA